MAASCPSTCYYDVFLSFRGEDTRKSFTDHLYTALIRQGFITFRDDDEAEKGENLKFELQKAIRQSKSSILVLSKDYATSTWCLDELVMILEKRRSSEINHPNDPKRHKHEVLPVFYDVKPSHLRKQSGTIAEAFVGYEKQIDAETDPEKQTSLMEKIKGWRSALTEVADLIGLELQNHDSGHEAKFIEKIIAVIGDKLRRASLHVAPYEIGMESRAKSINKWLQDKSSDVSVIAICGMGGIGKTTIAKYVYNQNYDSFDGSSFLADIREVSKQPNGLVRLQTQLVSEISKRKHVKIYNVHEGLAKIKNLICSKKVLLVLDDVDQADHIHDICGMQDWLFPGSKVIITTRRERLLEPHQVYKVMRLDQDESIKLFSLHAFGEDRPIESYIEHTKRVVQICEGLPLALKVIGSSLSRKSAEEWVCELEKLEAVPHNEILTKLRTSFDSLQDDYDKRLFLHIACFFVGTGKDYAIKILEKCDLHAKIGIQNLIDRCLLERDSHKVLKMHKLIQDMGREIIHQESQEPGERSRLWHHRETLSVLQNETGTKIVEGLTFDMRTVEKSGNNAKKRRYEEFFGNSILSKYVSSLKRRCLSLISGQSISTTLTSLNDAYLRTGALKSMTNLRLLKLNYVKLTGNYDNFPKGLVWLSWHGFCLEFIPTELSLERVVVLDLSHSRLQQVWKKTPFLESLKILDMSYSKRLKRTPNFLGLPNLERLILKGCVSLVEVCESIENLEMLEVLNLSGCKSIRKLPRNIGKLGSLKTLDMSGCNISEMRDVEYSLETMKQIVWSMVSTPRKVPHTLWAASLPFCLTELDLSRCNLSDDSFPDNFGDLPSLLCLNLSDNPFRRLPNCIRSLSGLVCLYIWDCNRLQSLELDGLYLSAKSVRIMAGYCKSLQKISFLDHGFNVYLLLDGCSKLAEVGGYLKIKSPREVVGMEITNHSLELKNYNMVPLSLIDVFFEFGITSIIAKGSFPLLCMKRSEGSSISFTVPLLVTHNIQCLNVCCTYEFVSKERPSAYRGIYLKIENKTKDLTWIYCPRYVLNLDMEHMEWLSMWTFGNNLAGGDEITVTFDGACAYDIKKCGYKIVYNDQEEGEENGGGTTDINKSHHEFLEFRLSTGEYFLCRDFIRKPDEDYWFPKDHKHLLH